MRRAASWLVFPLIVGAEIAGALVLVSRGVPAAVVVGAAFATTIAAIAVLERLLPYRAEWNSSRGDLAADAAYLPTTVGVNALLEPGLKALGAVWGAALSGLLGIGFWPTAWPLAGQLLLACVVAEFFDYFAHRVMHERPWLWRLHATHHSAPRLYWCLRSRSRRDPDAISTSPTGACALRSLLEPPSFWRRSRAGLRVFRHGATAIGPAQSLDRMVPVMNS